MPVLPRHPAAVDPSRILPAAIVLGGLVVGTLDLLFATGFWATRGVPPIRILQSIAAGVLGQEAAVAGGLLSATLGATLHYGIATMMVLAYAVASVRFDALRRRPIVYGLLYGLFLYAAMQYVIVPLSAASTPARLDLPWVLSSIVAHMALVGVPCVLLARRAVRRRPASVPAAV